MILNRLRRGAVYTRSSCWMVCSQVSASTCRRAAAPRRSTSDECSVTDARAVASARASGAVTNPFLVVRHQLGRPTAVAARDHRLRRGERLDRDETVVLLRRGKADSSTACELLEQRRVADRAQKRHALVDAAVDGLLTQSRSLVAVTHDHAADARRLGLGERIDHQVDPLERREPRHDQYVAVVPITAVCARRRRWIQHPRGDPAPSLEPRLESCVTARTDGSRCE